MPETPETPPRPIATRALPAVLVGFSLLLFGWTAWEGWAGGQHRVLPESVEKHQSSVAVAVSDLRYGLNRGYAAYNLVRHELVVGGWTWNPDILGRAGLRYPDNLTDTYVLDAALDRAVHLPDPAGAGVQYLPVFAEDVGYADFAKIGFRVFGYRLSSLYFGYFLVMGVSLGLYLLAYRRDVPMLLLLVGLQVGFFLLVRALPQIGSYEIYPAGRLQLATVINGRFLGTLGLVPFLHLAGLMLTWPRLTAGRVGLAAGQAAVLGLALHFRGSALGMFAALFVLAAAPAAAWLWRHRRELLGRPFTLRAGGRLALARWPVAVVALGLIGQKAYVASATHWTYHTDDGLPNHLFWHNALLALEFHPDWKHQSINPGGKSNDELAWALSEKRLDEEGVGKKYLISPITGGYKARLHDQLCKRTYLAFVRDNTRFMAELTFWHKPKLLWKFAADDWGWIRPGFGRPDAVGFLVGFAVCLVLSALGTDPAAWRVPVAAAAVGVAGSLLPLFWAYPFFHVLNEFLVLTGVLAVGLGVVVVRGVTRFRLPRVGRVLVSALGRRAGSSG
jgi:hypothetical protein